MIYGKQVYRIIVSVVVLCGVLNGMELKKEPKKEPKSVIKGLPEVVSYNADRFQPISSRDLCSYINDVVYWRRNTTDMYQVTLGTLVAGTASYKIYDQKSRAGYVCDPSELYRNTQEATK